MSVKVMIRPYRWMDGFFSTILFILCIFVPEFRHIPHAYTWMLAFLGIMTLTNKSFVSRIGFFNKKTFKYWFFLIIGFVVVLLPPIINQTYDFSYIKVVIGIALSSFRGILLLYVCYKKNHDRILDEYCKYFFSACNVYLLFTLMFIAVPTFKEYWLNNVIAETYVTDYVYYNFRYSLNGFAAFSAASIFSFASLLCGTLLAKDAKLNRLHIIQFMLCAVGCFFYGRIAIVGIALGICIIVIGKNYFSKVAKILGRILIVTCMLLLLLNVLSKNNEQFYYWQRWAFAFIRQFFVEHEITDHSYMRLSEMYFFPDWSTFFFGDGYYTDPVTGRYYMSTDSGYMRIILYTGLIGMLLLFGVLEYVLSVSYKAQKNNRINKIFVCFIFLLWLVLEWKGESYQRILLLFYPFFLVLTNKKSVEADDEEVLVRNEARTE